MTEFKFNYSKCKRISFAEEDVLFIYFESKDARNIKQNIERLLHGIKGLKKIVLIPNNLSLQTISEIPESQLLKLKEMIKFALDRKKNIQS